MSYIEKYTTRWHDTDASRLTRPSALLVYMQETSNLHVASTGMTLDRLRDEKGLAFILSKIRIDLHRRPAAFEELTVKTWTVPARGYMSTRFFRMTVGDEVIAECDSTWALIDIDSKELRKMEESGYAFGDGEAIALCAPSRTRAPSDIEFCEVGKRRICYSDLDYNMHMNNTRYPDMLCDHLPLEEVEGVKSFSLSYLHEGAYGKEITVLRGKRDNLYYFKTVNDDGVTCLEAVVGIE